MPVDEQITAGKSEFGAADGLAGRRGVRYVVVGLALASVGLLVMVLDASRARADAVAYLVNVTVRPGYSFANAEHALAYGHGICDKVRVGRPFAEIMGHVKTDFHTSDEYQGSYLISQAVNELCPALIWQLRDSAAGYRPPGP